MEFSDILLLKSPIKIVVFAIARVPPVLFGQQLQLAAQSVILPLNHTGNRKK